MSRAVFVRDAEMGGGRVDVRMEGAVVVAVGPSLPTRPGDDVVEACGAALLPGLHDHHLHLLALAAAGRSVAAGPPATTDAPALAETVRAADGALPPGAWLRAVGYHESVAGPLDRWVLDALVPERPVRVQHRSGGLWVLNSAAVRAVGLEEAVTVDGIERLADGTPTGRLWRLDDWLRRRLPVEPVALDGVGERLLRRGVTAVTDATPTDDPAAVELLAAAVAAGDLPQHVVVTGGADLPADAAPELARGPVKLLLADHDPPPLPEVVAAVRAARAQDRAVAVHCVTTVAAVLTVAALEEVGAVRGDRIEHGAVVPLDLAGRIAALGVTVVTNPAFVAERGDRYLEEVEAHELDDLWRCASLLDRGVRVGAGTDAPFGSPDPWSAIAAATDRRTVGGRVVGPEEVVSPERALALFLTPLDDPGGPVRVIEPGAPADACLLATPLAPVLADPRSAMVAATIVRGRLHRW